jgi:hypothetical protein
MNRERITELYKKYELTKDDVFKHQHYLIITRSGIEKIQAIEKINVNYEVVKCEADFAAVKAYNDKLETFGSALYGGKEQNEQGKWIDIGNTTSRYILEIAEKRALSRLVLKQTGFYELGVFSEDESEDFKRKNN